MTIVCHKNLTNKGHPLKDAPYWCGKCGVMMLDFDLGEEGAGGGVETLEGLVVEGAKGSLKLTDVLNVLEAELVAGFGLVFVGHFNQSIYEVNDGRKLASYFFCIICQLLLVVIFF